MKVNSYMNVSLKWEVLILQINSLVGNCTFGINNFVSVKKKKKKKGKLPIFVYTNALWRTELQAHFMQVRK